MMMTEPNEALVAATIEMAAQMKALVDEMRAAREEREAKKEAEQIHMREVIEQFASQGRATY